jgi:hypothetical protein
MYRIENILARNISKKTVIKRSTMRFQSLLNFETPLSDSAMALFNRSPRKRRYRPTANRRTEGRCVGAANVNLFFTFPSLCILLECQRLNQSS